MSPPPFFFFSSPPFFLFFFSFPPPHLPSFRGRLRSQNWEGKKGRGMFLCPFFLLSSFSFSFFFFFLSLFWSKQAFMSTKLERALAGTPWHLPPPSSFFPRGMAIEIQGHLPLPFHSFFFLLFSLSPKILAPHVMSPKVSLFFPPPSPPFSLRPAEATGSKIITSIESPPPPPSFFFFSPFLFRGAPQPELKRARHSAGVSFPFPSFSPPSPHRCD